MINVGSILANRYEIIALIGSGGMADVYQAKDHKLDRQVAIKVLKEEYSKDRDFVTHFRIEGQAAAGLNNANIVGIYDVGNVGDTYYIVMELIEGITLKDYISRKGTLSPKETMAISAQVAVGLKAAHERHIVHRDIKPQNIILSKDGKVKVTDFGIARTITDETKSLNTSTMGSVHYIAPEQAQGAYCDERSDIYSLGIVMYEMITGKVPYEKETSVAVAIAHINEAMVPPSQINPKCPKGLEQIIFRCTQKSRERRYKNCNELLADLKTAVASPDYNFEKREQENLLKSDTLVFSPEEVEAIKRKTIGSSASAVITQNTETDPSQNAEAVPVQRVTMERSEEDDEEAQVYKEEEEKNPSDRLVIILSVIFGIVMIALLVYIIGGLSGCFKTVVTKEETTTTTQTVETGDIEEFDPETQAIVPNVVGMNTTAAIKSLQSKNLNYKISTEYEYSDIYAIGVICKQEFEEGTVVQKDTVITLYMSAGTDKFEIKSSYVGGLLSSFKNDFEKFESIIDVEYKEVESNEVATNHIISIDPSSGKVGKGGKITVTYSSGPSEVAVPNLYNVSEVLAKTKLEDAGLKLGEITYEYDKDVEKDLICSQNIAANTMVQKNTKIDIVLSLGVRMVKVPNVVGMVQDDAKNILEKAGLIVEIEEKFDDDIIYGNIISQDPDVDSNIAEGSTVKLIVSKGKEEVLVEVPNVLSSTREDAVKILEAAGFVVSIEEDYSDQMAGNVISQSPEEKTNVKEGSTVKIVISKGPKETETTTTTVAPTPAPTPTPTPTSTTAPTPTSTTAPTPAPTPTSTTTTIATP